MITRRTVLVGMAGTGLTVAASSLLVPHAYAATAFVITNCNTAVNRRSGPGTGYRLLGTIPKGASFSGEQSGGWVKVLNGIYAGSWVSATYARPATTPATPTPNNSRYTTSVLQLAGGVPITSGWNGTRIYLIRRKFGTDAPTSAGGTYNADTRSRVIAFQKANGLKPDGVVGGLTWGAMQLGHPFNVDAYTEQPRLPLSASAEERRERMISWALLQRGSRYAWGGAGPWELGFDCSGLVLQALYVAGLDSQPINVLKHAEPSYRSSRQLYASAKMPSVPVSQRRRGDLIFYTDRNGVVVHVAIDLGDGTMMESYGAVAGIRPVVSAYGASRIAPYVKRPF